MMKLVSTLIFVNYVLSSILIEKNCQEEFKKFKIKFNKHYSSLKQERRRLKTFCKNLNEINKHNKSSKNTFTKTINRFSDKSLLEMKNLQLGVDNLVPQGLAPFVSFSFISDYFISETEKPQKKDENNLLWSDYVTPVRNQMDDCGACYAFGTIEMVETVNQILTSTKYPSKNDWLSPQEIIDCSSFYGNYGCSGGNPASALKFLQENGAILDKDYPYTDSQARCYMVREEPVLFVDKFYQVEPKNQKLLKLALAKTPIVVAINMDKLFSYKEGIFDDWSCNTTDLDHVVMLVGYGYDEKLKKHFWLLKNSYGIEWGENGYFRIEMKNNDESIGICGITERALFATIKRSDN